eukprot:TRINITY_DN8692_c0_g1_i2.p1 TRINITY_DN8692_c0_g1~~TRINITY_DN8692_c0_g1_i2.p1  ORF type:complete len:448 (+),score=60.99 TRINITY_DN8692_c0_g1_i2:156-1499(+)
MGYIVAPNCPKDGPPLKTVLPVNVFTYEILHNKHRYALTMERKDVAVQPCLIRLIKGDAVVEKPPPEDTNTMLKNVRLATDSGVVNLRIPEDEIADACEEGTEPNCLKLLERQLVPRKVRDFKLRYVSGQERAIKVVAMATDESVFISGGSVGMISQSVVDVIDTRTLKKVGALPVHCYPITSAEFSTSSQLLMTCDNTDTVTMWDMNTFHVKKTIELPESDDLKEYRLACVKLTPDNTTIMAAGEEIHSTQTTGVVLGWSMSSHETPLFTFTEHPERIQGMAVRSCGKLIVSSDKGGTVLVWKWEDMTVVHTWKMPGSTPFVNFTPDGKSVIAVCERVLAVWDVETGKPLVSRHLESDPIFEDPMTLSCKDTPGSLIAVRYLVMSWVPGNFIICSTSQNFIILYDVETLEEVSRFVVRNKVICVACSRNRITFGDLWGNVGVIDIL